MYDAVLISTHYNYDGDGENHASKDCHCGEQVRRSTSHRHEEESKLPVSHVKPTRIDPHRLGPAEAKEQENHQAHPRDMPQRIEGQPALFHLASIT